MTALATGIRDPENPDRWLVWPWPDEAGFCEVVRHFLNACWPLFGDTSPVRQLAYYEGYQAALLAASTEHLHGPGAREWRDELLAGVERRIARHREQVAEQEKDGEGVQRVPLATAQERAS